MWKLKREIESIIRIIKFNWTKNETLVFKKLINLRWKRERSRKPWEIYRAKPKESEQDFLFFIQEMVIYRIFDLQFFITNIPLLLRKIFRGFFFSMWFLLIARVRFGGSHFICLIWPTVKVIKTDNEYTTSIYLFGL